MVREVCDVLGLKQVTYALANVDKTHLSEHRFNPRFGRPNKMVNEAGLYALVMRSNKPNAKIREKLDTSEKDKKRILTPGRNLTRCPARPLLRLPSILPEQCPAHGPRGHPQHHPRSPIDPITDPAQRVAQDKVLVQ